MYPAVILALIHDYVASPLGLHIFGSPPCTSYLKSRNGFWQHPDWPWETIWSQHPAEWTFLHVMELLSQGRWDLVERYDAFYYQGVVTMWMTDFMLPLLPEEAITRHWTTDQLYWLSRRMHMGELEVLCFVGELVARHHLAWLDILLDLWPGMMANMQMVKYIIGNTRDLATYQWVHEHLPCIQNFNFNQCFGEEQQAGVVWMQAHCAKCTTEWQNAKTSPANPWDLVDNYIRRPRLHMPPDAPPRPRIRSFLEHPVVWGACTGGAAAFVATWLFWYIRPSMR